MKAIPCEQNEELRQKIVEFAEALKSEAHNLGTHGLNEREFYDSGLFRGAIERIRGQFAADMQEKRKLVRHVLDYMRDKKAICGWTSAGEDNRHDYSVSMTDGYTAIIELKGCLDGNNTNIFERPPHANEFIIWSVCTNPGADPERNAWSGLHTRLSAEIISRHQRVDGLIIWDMACATLGRTCPKTHGGATCLTDVGPYRLPPPCIYVFPATIPSPRNNPSPKAQKLNDVRLLTAFQECFGGTDAQTNYVDFDIEHEGADTLRTTTIRRNGVVTRKSNPTAIRRT